MMSDEAFVSERDNLEMKDVIQVEGARVSLTLRI